MLKIGEVAPDFEFEDQKGQKNRFPEDFKGRWLALFFLRSLACPICLDKLEELNKSEQKYREEGVELFVVVQSSSKRVKEYGEKWGIRFRMIGDLERKIYSKYEVALGGLSAFFAPKVIQASVKATLRGHLHGRPEGNELQRPACFIIDPEGKIAYLEYGKNIADMMSEEKFFKVLAELKQGQK